MGRLTLSKSALTQQRGQLRLYQRFLPSLDLKRRQLIGEQARATQALAEREAKVAELTAQIGKMLPMLANQEIDVAGLVHVKAVRLGEENVVGVKLPVLAELVCEVRDYSMLAKPHWVDALVAQLHRMAELKIQLQVYAERVRCLERAVRRTTQRVNLFEKVLIPTAKQHIKRIQIFLADTERAAVVRSKIAKARHRPVASEVDTGVAP
ncbi:MAG: V-type ATP synthase subunit D [Phycisphaerales bacterium]